MEQLITKFIGPDSGFHYAMCFHYKDGCEQEFVKFIQDRFELEYWWKIERSERGNWHIQACGRTSKIIDDNHDRKRFQSNGYFNKFLKRRGEYHSEDVEGLKKPYSIAFCKKTWNDNILYVLKPFKDETTQLIRWQSFNGGTSETTELWELKCIEADEKFSMCQANHAAAVAKKAKVVSLDTRVSEWYTTLTDPPVTEMTIVERMYDDHVVPLGPYSEQTYARIAKYIMNRYVNDVPYKKIFLDRVSKYFE